MGIAEVVRSLALPMLPGAEVVQKHHHIGEDALAVADGGRTDERPWGAGWGSAWRVGVDGRLGMLALASSEVVVDADIASAWNQVG